MVRALFATTQGAVEVAVVQCPWVGFDSYKFGVSAESIYIGCRKSTKTPEIINGTFWNAQSPFIVSVAQGHMGISTPGVGLETSGSLRRNSWIIGLVIRSLKVTTLMSRSLRRSIQREQVFPWYRADCRLYTFRGSPSTNQFIPTLYPFIPELWSKYWKYSRNLLALSFDIHKPRDLNQDLDQKSPQEAWKSRQTPHILRTTPNSFKSPVYENFPTMFKPQNRILKYKTLAGHDNLHVAVFSEYSGPNCLEMPATATNRRWIRIAAVSRQYGDIWKSLLCFFSVYYILFLQFIMFFIEDDARASQECSFWKLWKGITMDLLIWSHNQRKCRCDLSFVMKVNVHEWTI